MRRAKTPSEDVPVDVEVAAVVVAEPEAASDPAVPAEVAPTPAAETPPPDEPQAVVTADAKPVSVEILVGLLHANGRFHAKGDRVSIAPERAARLLAAKHVRH